VCRRRKHARKAPAIFRRECSEQLRQPLSLLAGSANVASLANDRLLLGGKATAHVINPVSAALYPLTEPRVTDAAQGCFREAQRGENVPSATASVPHGPAEVCLDSLVSGVHGEHNGAARHEVAEARVRRLFAEQARILDRDSLRWCHVPLLGAG
jgi:hypothetical protein